MKLKFMWKQFGKDVRAARESTEYGLRQMARDLNIHHATWCRAEQGKPVTVEHFLFLCEWMEINPLQYLISAPRPRSAARK